MITIDIIEHIAEQARLNLTEKEKKSMISEIGEIIAYFNKLSKLDASDIRPMEHIIPQRNIFREDKVEKSFEREKILVNAPVSEKGFFKVPKFME
jgi:aspartyl-tRNA(Asn)/glutamyl-tRNA(Gln) amidotransferase subunit C